MNRFSLNKSGGNAKLGTWFGTCTMVALALVSSITMSHMAYAEGMTKGCEHQHWDGEHRHAFFEQHQKELHDKLMLTANQEPAWKAFIEKTKPGEKSDEMHKEADWANLKTPERMDLMLSKTKEREQQFEEHAQATKEFYKQLTPAQQKTFDESFQHHMHEHKGS